MFLKSGRFGIQEEKIFDLKVYFHLGAMKFNKYSNFMIMSRTCL